MIFWRLTLWISTCNYKGDKLFTWFEINEKYFEKTNLIAKKICEKIFISGDKNFHGIYEFGRKNYWLNVHPDIQWGNGWLIEIGL